MEVAVLPSWRALYSPSLLQREWLHPSIPESHAPSLRPRGSVPPSYRDARRPSVPERHAPSVSPGEPCASPPSWREGLCSSVLEANEQSLRPIERGAVPSQRAIAPSLRPREMPAVPERGALSLRPRGQRTISPSWREGHHPSVPGGCAPSLRRGEGSVLPRGTGAPPPLLERRAPRPRPGETARAVPPSRRDACRRSVSESHPLSLRPGEIAAAPLH